VGEGLVYSPKASNNIAGNVIKNTYIALIRAGIAAQLSTWKRYAQ